MQRCPMIVLSLKIMRKGTWVFFSEEFEDALPLGSEVGVRASGTAYACTGDVMEGSFHSGEGTDCASELPDSSCMKINQVL